MNLKEEYEKYGYVILKQIVSIDEVKSMRIKILDYFYRNPLKRMMLPSDVMNEFPEIYNIQTKKKLLTSLKTIFGYFYYVNDYQIQKNMCTLGLNDGWHIDAGSQYSLRLLNKELGNKYKFAKIGIYLNKDIDYGKSIEVIPFSHKSIWLRKIILLLIRIKFFRHFIIDFCDKKILPGDCIIFDSRILHRSAKCKNFVVRDNYACLDINDKSKLVIYFEAGSELSANQFIKSNLCRAVIEETDKQNEKYFSDYLRYQEIDYPEDFISKIKEYGKIATLDKTLQKLAEQIYVN